jgi:hypothetical protein
VHPFFRDAHKLARYRNRFSRTDLVQQLTGIGEESYLAASIV